MKFRLPHSSRNLSKFFGNSPARFPAAIFLRRPLSAAYFERFPISLHRIRRWQIVGALLGRIEIEYATDGGPEAVDGMLGGFAQVCLPLGEGLLDRMKSEL